MAWDDKHLEKDDVEAQELGFYNIWEMTQPNVGGRRMIRRVHAST